ncbi:MAG: DUF4129 domain-containing protein [Nocardioidaceae bacterium]
MMRADPRFERVRIPRIFAVAAAWLLAVAAIGPLPALSSRSVVGESARGNALALAAIPVGATVVAGVLWMIYRVSQRRKGTPPEQVPELETHRKPSVLVLGVVLATLLVPWLILAAVSSHVGFDLGTTATPQHPVPSTAPHPVPKSSVGSAATSSGSVTLLLIALIVVAGIALVAYLATHVRRNSGDSAAPAKQPADSKRQTVEAVEAAGRRLAAPGSPRDVVIAAYVELESAVRRLGLQRDPVDTPDDLLARLTQRRRNLTGEAELLTELFQRARFSSFHITAGDVTSAKTALAAIAAGLETS